MHRCIDGSIAGFGKHLKQQGGGESRSESMKTKHVKSKTHIYAAFKNNIMLWTLLEY